MLHAENQEGLVDFHDVMDVVYRMTRIGMYHCTLHALSCRPRIPKPRPLRHENQPGLADFQRATLKNTERHGYLLYTTNFAPKYTGNHISAKINYIVYRRKRCIYMYVHVHKKSQVGSDIGGIRYSQHP